MQLKPDIFDVFVIVRVKVLSKLFLLRQPIAYKYR